MVGGRAQERTAGRAGAIRLLEREAQRAAIEARIGALARGEGSLLLLEGPAGIGKTELVRLACSVAEQAGVRWLQARGGQLERGFPFGIARQLFDPPLERASAEERASLLEGAASRARPVLRLTDPADEPPGADTLEASFHGLYWLTANLAARAPLVLAVDDIHWADPSSLRFLAYLAHRREGLPVALLLAARTGEGEGTDQLHQHLGEVEALRIPALSPEAVSELCAQRLGEPVDPAFALACERVTRGNPYLLSELLTSLSEDEVAPTAAAAERIEGFAPQTVARAVLTRLARLSPGAEQLARAVALLGTDAELRHAARIARLDELEAARAADTLVAASILGPQRPLEFTHPLVRSAVYEELPVAERGLDQRRAAELLAAEGADASRVAAHLLAVEPASDPWVVERLLQAAHAVAREGSLDAAVHYLERAVEEPPSEADRSKVLLELGTAQSSLWSPDAVPTLRSALESARDDRVRVLAARALARTMHMRGESLAAAEVLQDSIARLAAADGGLSARLGADALLLTQSALDARGLLLDTLTHARAEAERLTGPTAPIVQAVVAVDLAHTNGSSAQAVQMAERALAGAGSMQDGGDLSVAFYLITVSLALCDHLSMAESLLDRAAEDARRRGSLIDLQSAMCLRAWVLYRRGRLRDAEADARLALDRAPAAGADVLRAWKLAALGEVLIERGGLEEAGSMLSPSELGPYDEDSILYQPFRDARARLCLVSGEAEDALEHLRAEDGWEQRWGVRNTSWTSWRSHAVTAHTALGNEDEARALAADELQRARAFGAPRAHGIALRVSGIAQRPADTARLEEAVSVLSDSEARLEHARALYELGAAQRRAGGRVKARDSLRAALDLADRCGAPVLADRVREELHSAGARPRRERISGVEALTAQERRVSQLAAHGLTNREVAEALFLTQKTIEMHLANSYRKLDIAGRKELPATLAESEAGASA